MNLDQVEPHRTAERRRRYPWQLISGPPIVGYDLVKFFHCSLHGKTRNHRSKAGMYATAEPEMAPRLTANVIHVCIRKLALISITRAIGQADEIAGLHLLPMQFEIFLQAATKALCGCVVPQGFFHRIR